MDPVPMDPVSPQTGLGLTRFLAAGLQAGPDVGLRPVPAIKREDEPSRRAQQGDSVELSPRALASLAQDSESEGSATSPELTPEEEEQVRELAARDREVRAHEQAHKAAGGDLAGAPRYEYETGPDDKRYAVGGEVAISLREGSTAAETGEIAKRVRRAALAPAQPSAQDMAVAAKASQMAARARAEEAKEQRESEDSEPVPGDQDPRQARAAQAYGEISHAGRGPADGAAALLDLMA